MGAMTRLARVACLGVFGVLLAIGVAARPPKQEDVLKRLANYRDWTRVNAHPALMDQAASSLCSYQPGLPPFVPSSDPHKNHYVTVYVNDIGKRAMMKDRATRFPSGSIIVKEKLIERTIPSSYGPELLTVMIKRDKGFNPKVGDWEFLLVSGDGKARGAR